MLTFNSYSIMTRTSPLLKCNYQHQEHKHITMTNHLPCPIIGCKHTHNGSQRPFTSITTVIWHLISHAHSQSLHLINKNICHEIKLYSWCSKKHNCPTHPHQFFPSQQAVLEHNSTNHAQSTQNQQYPNHTTEQFTNITYATKTTTNIHNNWTNGIDFINSTFSHDPPHFWSTWRQYLKNTNKKLFLQLQANTIKSIIKSTIQQLSPLLVAPSPSQTPHPCTNTKEKWDNESIAQTICQQLTDFQSGNIETLFKNATSEPPPNHTENCAAQLAADADNYTTINLAKLNNNTINKTLNSLFNIIYKGEIPQQACQLFTNTYYLFCLHKDQKDLQKLRPIGIPMAISCLLATHIALTMKDRFAQYLLPCSFAIGIKGGINFMIKAMLQSIKKIIQIPQQHNKTPSRTAILWT